MQRVAAGFADTQRQCADRDIAALQRWLKLRADDICGAHVVRTADLFGTAPDLPPWKSLNGPLDRLAAFAADADNAAAKRREANSAVALYRRRCEVGTADLALSPPRLQPIGMLLLVPEGSVHAANDAAVRGHPL